MISNLATTKDKGAQTIRSTSTIRAIVSMHEKHRTEEIRTNPEEHYG
jgi:hypothetical protein